jgi:glycine oxidase
MMFDSMVRIWDINRVGTNQLVLVATGHYRNGILLAPATARIIGEMLLV